MCVSRFITISSAHTPSQAMGTLFASRGITGMGGWRGIFRPQGESATSQTNFYYPKETPAILRLLSPVPARSPRHARIGAISFYSVNLHGTSPAFSVNPPAKTLSRAGLDPYMQFLDLLCLLATTPSSARDQSIFCVICFLKALFWMFYLLV